MSEPRFIFLNPLRKSFKEMVDALDEESKFPSSESDDDDFEHEQPLHKSELYFIQLEEPTENEKQLMQRKLFMSDSFDFSHDFQMVKTRELWEYKEFDRSLTPKNENNKDHLEQVRRFILKNGFQEPFIISCDLKTGKAYVSEGNHRLWVAIREGIPFVPCRVVPHWLPPPPPMAPRKTLKWT